MTTPPATDPIVTAEGFADYLGQARGCTDATVANVRRIVGGASRVTYALDATWSEEGELTEAGLIVRLDPPASLLDSNRTHEYAAYRGMYGSDVPVPEPLWIEDDESWFGGAFFVMRRIDGCETSPQRLFAPPLDAVGERIGVELFEIAGRIAAIDSTEGAWDFLDPVAPERCWQRELDHWSEVIERHRSDAQPIVRAAIDWLRRHPPPEARRISVVHGDYRNGNVLVDPTGEIRGVLDWEMCHLGDPIEDLAWTCMPNWRWGRPDRYGGFLPPPEAFAIWERASGLEVNRDAFHWWSVFAHVKAQGIWLTGAHNFARGAAGAINLPGIALRLSPIEERGLISLLGWDADAASEEPAPTRAGTATPTGEAGA